MSEFYNDDTMRWNILWSDQIRESGSDRCEELDGRISTNTEPVKRFKGR